MDSKSDNNNFIKTESIVEIKEAESPLILYPNDRSFTAMCEHIAACAGVCYDRKKEKKGDDAIKFVRNIVKFNHGRALEFGTMIMTGFYKDETSDTKFLTRDKSPYVKKFDVYEDGYDFVIITNLRYYLETLFTDRLAGFDKLQSFWNDEDYDGVNNVDPRTKLEMADDYTFIKYRNMRPTVFYPLLSRAIADEFRTHTMLSSLMQSTRYTGAGGDVPTFVLSHYVADRPLQDLDRQNYIQDYRKACSDAYSAYKSLLITGHEKQFARDILPLGIGTQLVQCGFLPAWYNLIDLRSHRSAHPDAQHLANLILFLFAANEIKRPKSDW